MGTRQLYTDADEVLFTARRPVVMNGIEEMVTRPDLLDRAVLLYMPRIHETERRQEADLLQDFEQARPMILGALLDAVSAGMRDLGHVVLSRVPRMADFAVFVTAAEAALGWERGAFIDAYAANRDGAHALTVEASPIAQVVLEFAKTVCPTVEATWTGTASTLLARLTNVANEATRKQRGWPEGPKPLSDALRRLAPTLSALGMSVEFNRKGHGGVRLLTLKRTVVSASPASPPPPVRDGYGDVDPGTATHSAPAVLAAAAPVTSRETDLISDGDAGDAAMPGPSQRRVRALI
jgi:hypothetical protein